jgi:hypothetical protein
MNIAHAIAQTAAAAPIAIVSLLTVSHSGG